MVEERSILDDIPLEALLVKLHFDLKEFSKYEEIVVFGMADLKRCRTARQKIVEFVGEKIGQGDYKVQFALFEKMGVLLFISVKATGLGDELLKLTEEINGKDLAFAVEGSGADLDLGYIEAMSMVEGFGENKVPKEIQDQLDQMKEAGDIDLDSIETEMPKEYKMPSKTIDLPFTVLRISVLGVISIISLFALFSSNGWPTKLLIFFVFLVSTGWIGLDIWKLSSREK